MALKQMYLLVYNLFSVKYGVKNGVEELSAITPLFFCNYIIFSIFGTPLITLW